MATQNNEDRSDTESNQEGKILETHAITTMVHEMKVKGFHLVENRELLEAPPSPAYNTGVEINEMDEKSRHILEDNVEKGINYWLSAFPTITDSEQDQEKTQCRRPTCPCKFSDLPPYPSYNVEEGISSLITTDQEKTQGRHPTCPPGFSDIPRAQKNNFEEEEKVKMPKVFEDNIQHWGREYSTDLSCKYPVEIPNSMVHGYYWF